MTRQKFPSDEKDQFMVRMPEGMRDAIWKQSVANKRSMNAEFVARLEASLSLPSTHADHANTIIGMYFIRDAGEFYNVGRIVSEVGDKIYLLKTAGPEEDGIVRPFELMALEEMLGFNDSGMPCMSLFKSHEELDAWIKWLSAPDKPNVVNLVKPTK